MQETRQDRISRLLQKELSLIFQSQTRMMHGVMVTMSAFLSIGAATPVFTEKLK